MSLELRTLLAVALGGALGSLLRYAVESLFPAPAGGVPWGTLLVNVVGSAALGALVVVLDHRPAGPARRGFLTTGLLGGFTTFSTYAVHVAVLAGQDVAVAVAYTAATPVLCLVAAWLAATGVRRTGRHS